MPAAALRDTTLLNGVISFSNTGDNTVVAATANQSIRVYRIIFTVSAATNVIFKNGSTALTGAFVLTGNGSSFVLDLSHSPWFTTSVGSAFIINQSGTATVSGKLDYQKP